MNEGKFKSTSLLDLRLLRCQLARFTIDDLIKKKYGGIKSSSSPPDIPWVGLLNHGVGLVALLTKDERKGNF